jgi:hypothetical protein
VKLGLFVSAPFLSSDTPRRHTHTHTHTHAGMAGDRMGEAQGMGQGVRSVSDHNGGE